MDNQHITIKGCRENNLKNLDLTIPRNKLVVITGPSGSGKSSLAFDTLYKEGQRRYVESINSFGQQFLEQFQPPDVDSIEGLSPTIAIRSKRHSSNSRSTVATSSGIYDLLRILFSNFGVLKDPDTGIEIKSYSVLDIASKIINLNPGTKIQILVPVVFSENSTIENIISKYEQLGFSRVLVADKISYFSELNPTKDNIKNFKVLIDRIITKEGIYKRLIDSLELAYRIGNGKLFIIEEGKEYTFCENKINPVNGQIYPKLTPQFFSFNRPEGACPKCKGTGQKTGFNIELLIFDDTLKVEDGAIHLITSNSYIYNFTLNYLQQNGTQDKPLKNFSEYELNELFFGSKSNFNFSFTSNGRKFELENIPFPGVINWLNENIEESDFKVNHPCELCRGGKLNQLSLSTFFHGKNISEITALNIKECVSFFSNLNFTDEEQVLLNNLYQQLIYKLTLLNNIGLTYLTLDRNTSTLSGGEVQRLNIASQLGSKLSGVLYILDEPTNGVHYTEIPKIIDSIINLKSNGNSVIVVEHNPKVIKSADHLIIMGPKSGINGGQVVYSGLLDNNKITSTLEINQNPRQIVNTLIINNINKNNIADQNLVIPLGNMVTVTGVSGSGKSTLIHEVLAKACRDHINKKPRLRDVNYNSICGLDNIKNLIEITSKPIGKSPNSIPATYLDIYKYIRELFASTNESKLRGYTSKRFSFNVKGGRCENCEGRGLVKIDMHFLADLWANCHICNGNRFNPDTLSILYKGMSISDILKMTASEALEFFKNHSKIFKTLSLLCNLDLSYITLGQSSTELSGGESQRLKIVKELSKRTIGHTLYILDEPSGGLHSTEIKFLLKSLNNLVDNGHTVIVIEHNLEIICTSDYVIDLGPGAGPEGGKILYQGNIQGLLTVKNSKTGEAITSSIKKGPDKGPFHK